MRLPLLLLVAAAIASGLWVVQCSGPAPQVTAVKLTPPTSPGAPYQVQTTIHNGGLGHGEVAVIFRLRDPATGQTVQQQETADLDKGESVVLVASINAPPGNYVPEVKASYPVGS